MTTTNIKRAGAFVLAFVVSITYYPALWAGFWFDDYGLMEAAGRPSWSSFLISSFDPRLEPLRYRPLRILQWRVEYSLLGGDALGYHIIQNAVHVLNCILLYAVISRLTKNWRAGFIGALIYSVLPALSLSVFWLATPDALASFFYLVTIWLWLDYLEKAGRWRLGLAFASFVIGLLTKEVVLPLPVTLLLIDRWLVAKPTRWQDWVARNAPFFAFLPIWAILEQNGIAERLTAESSHADWMGIISNLGYYVGAMSFPWAIDSAVRYLVLAVLAGLFLYAVVMRKYRILFLGIVGALSVIPMANSVGGGSRYLYLPLMVSAAGLGVVVASLLALVQNRISNQFLAIPLTGLLVLAVTYTTLSESFETFQAAEGFSTLARQTRLQFSPILQRHSAFEPDTLLYFIEPPFSSYNISGLMFLHYGANVTVNGNDVEGTAGLRNNATAYVFYPDEQGVLNEKRVDQKAPANVSATLPVQLGPTISLDGFEVVNTQAKPGEALILILYWRALAKIDRDYTVFAHLVDDKGAVIAGSDSQPHRGTWPTTMWQPGRLVEDAVIIPISSDVPASNGYRIEAGMYYLPTMERLSVVDKSQSIGRDVVTFDSFTIEP